MRFLQVSRLSAALFVMLSAACASGPGDEAASLVITFTAAPEALTSKRIATFAFTANKQVAFFECRVDAVPFALCTSPVTLNQMQDGAHSFEVRGYDVATGILSEPTRHQWTVDAAAPETTLVGTYPVVTSSNTLRFEFSSEANATFECSIDGAPFTGCTSPTELRELLESSHRFDVRAVDAQGNADPTPASHTWTVDQTPPDTGIESGPEELTTSASARFTFTSNEEGTFLCSIDGAAATTCPNPLELSAVADGIHELEVQAVDLAGNVDPSPAQYGWTVDSAPPDTSIVSAVAGANATTALFAFEATEPGCSFECSVDGAPFVSCTSPQMLSGLSDGPHTFAVRAIDELNHVDPTPAEHAWTVDVGVPDTFITASTTPANGGATSFEFGADEPGVTFECSLDSAPFVPCASPMGYASMTDGTHTFAVRATDGSSNTDASPATVSWLVDTQPPETTFTLVQTDEHSSNATFSFGATEANSSFECSLDSAAFAPCASPKSYGALADGEHTFAVRAVDASGNADPTPATHAWTITTAAPDTTITASTASLTSRSASFSFACNKTGCTFECSLDDAPMAACSSPKVYSGLADGAHTFRVRAIGSNSAVDQTPATESWRIDLTPPETSIVQAQAATGSTSASFTFQSSEQNSTFECRLDGATFAPCTSPRSYTGLSEGPHTFQVRATDDAGNTDPSPASHNWTIDTQAPETTLSNAETAPTSRSATFTFSSPDGTSFECSLDGAPFTSCTSPRSYSSLSDGSHTFAVRAVDGVGNVDPTPATVTWSIDATPPETTITSAPSGSTSSTTASITFASNEAGSTFECSLNSSPFAPCTSPVSYSSLTGSQTFQVRAIDAAGNPDESPAVASWSVVFAPETTITVAPSGTLTSPGASISFTSPDSGVTFECSLDSEPFAWCLSPVQLTALTDGAHTFRVRALTSSGASDPTPATASWTVAVGAIDTYLTSVPGSTSSTIVSFAFSSSRANATFQCRLDSGSFANCTSPVTYNVSVGSHTFEVRAVGTDATPDATPASHTWTVQQQVHLRLIASNLSSGNLQKYEGPGDRILQGLQPDIVMMQEFNVGSNSTAEIQHFVRRTFGPTFVYYRETAGGIPNGVVSRYPILQSGSWNDPILSDREFAYAHIDIPGSKDLWVVSVHLKAGSDTAVPPALGDAEKRDAQANALVTAINTHVPAGDYLTLGGDFNAQHRSEAFLTTLSQMLITTGPYPVDQASNGNTNAGRNKPYDWVITDSDLSPYAVPVVIGLNSFTNGLVFDSRVYSPLADVAPVLQSDSGAVQMQHQAVVRDFLLPGN